MALQFRGPVEFVFLLGMMEPLETLDLAQGHLPGPPLAQRVKLFLEGVVGFSGTVDLLLCESCRTLGPQNPPLEP